MPLDEMSFNKIATVLCNKPQKISASECFLARDISDSMCKGHKICRIAEKSDEQLGYVLHPAQTSSFLIACAGSGKTEVVGLKAAYEIKQWKQKYTGIAVLTFTNNAADVIQERVLQIAGLSGIGSPHFIGTFDSWLHNYIANPFLHLRTGYKGLGNDSSLRIVEDKLDSGFLHSFETKYAYNHGRKIKANEFFLDAEAGNFVFSSSDQKTDRIRNQTDWTDWQKKDLDETKKRFWKAGFVTYQDIEYLCYLLLKHHTNASRRISNRFPIIIIDECQDLAWSQLQILQKLLDKGTVLHFVGDLNQGIYAFRKVYPEKVDSFVKNNQLVQLRLTRNYRSLQPIVDLSSRLVGQGSIVGQPHGNSIPVCLCISYEKSKLMDLPNWFIKLLEERRIDVGKSAILARNNQTVAKLQPGIINDISIADLPAMAIKIWGTPGRTTEQMQVSLSLLGKFIALYYFPNHSCNRQQQYCPEAIKSRIKWRRLLADVLIKCCNDKLLANLNLTWGKWAGGFRDKFPTYLLQAATSYRVTLESDKKYIAPRGKSGEPVISTIQIADRNPSTRIRITNFHQIKGETMEAVMVVSSPTNQGEGCWKNWLKDKKSENARFAYVASTRPKSLLVWAVPGKLTESERTDLKNIGFEIVP